MVRAILMTIGIMAMLMAQNISSAGSSTTLPLMAMVDPQLELTAVIYEGEVGGPVKTNIDFGQMVQDQPGGSLRGEKYYTVQLSAVSSARHYKIIQSVTAPLSNGNVSIPNGACVVTPHTNGITAPSGSQLGARGTFIEEDKLIYESEPAGSEFPVYAVYAITNDPGNGATEFVAPDQQAGSYQTQVTFTVLLAS